MTLVLRDDEKIENQLETNSVYGQGNMYVATNAIVLEQGTKGIFFEMLHVRLPLLRYQF